VVSNDAVDGNDVTITSGAGGVTINNQLFALGGLGIAATNGGDVTVNNVALGTPLQNTVYAGGSVTIFAEGNITTDRDIVSATDITLDAGLDLDVSKIVKSKDPMGNLASGQISLNAAGNVNLDNAVINTLADVYIEADSDSSGTGAVTITNALIGDVDSYGYGGAYSSSSTANSVSIVGAGISISTDNSTIEETLIGGDSVTLVSTNGGDIDITAAAGGTLQYLDASTSIFGLSSLTVNADGDLNLTSSDVINYNASVVALSSGGMQSITADTLSMQSGSGFGSGVGMLVTNQPGSALSPSQTINVSNLVMDGAAGGVNTPSGGVFINSVGDQNISVTNNFLASGTYFPAGSYSSNMSYGPPGGGSYIALGSVNTSINSQGVQTIDVGGRLELSGAEIVSSENYYSGSPINAESSVTTADLVVTNARIGLNRDSAVDSSTFVLTTTGANSTIDGIMNPAGPDAYGLLTNGVKWVNTGTVVWNSGSVLMSNQGLLQSQSVKRSPTKILSSSETLFANQGRLELNSESGTFDMRLYDDFGSEIGVGGLLNTGELVKSTGAGTSLADFNVQNNNGKLISESGTLEFGANTVTQTGSNAELLLVGGNISASGGLFDLRGGTLGGGVVDQGTVQTGGTLTGDVRLTNTTVTPGFSPGRLTIDGNLDATGGNNRFEFEVDADTGNIDQLRITGDANLSAPSEVANTIEILQSGQFDPDTEDTVNQNFNVIEADSLTLGSTQLNLDSSDSSVTANIFESGGDLTVSFSRSSSSEGGVGTPDDIVEPEPPVVVIVDELPLVLPPDIVDIIVNLDEDEQQEFLESEKVKKFLRKVNMCLAKA
ncbi:MAG: hypothetical protein MK188_12460, partial [Gammaproteobacteria bacterium]|nr:hypothetical protein [Gammaproteobacteria bacterium]